ncbi:3-oxosteroid 1-dehydrogenase [Novosphingobium sp. CF614]|uniref:FAD-dependent oxidoreductase n=1 Tax=Novosphingobium sp. CF614 TaxID=1884364 RepID=UPI0008EB76AC|nr:FAD-dependent oxidoreductase [Novosphingobium sp. CF614]SFG25451.1 3-oxosteroid 1-dehydrogenase [Novosphingobium sp. CF614]
MSDIDCDVLIVGSGIGGLTAAIAARVAGLRPILVEKQHLVGGSSALSNGALWLPNNPLMIREKVHDSRDAALTYLGNFVADDDPGSSLARRGAFLDGVAPVVALLEAQGIPLQRCEGYSDYYDLLPGGNAAGRAIEVRLFDANLLGPWRRRLRPQSFRTPARASESAELSQMGASWEGKAKTVQVLMRALDARLRGKALLSAGAALQGRMLLAALNRGCDIRTNAGLEELAERNGRVTGAVVNFDGWKRRINAHYGVVVAAGGFSHNRGMRARWQDPLVDPQWSSANPGDTGEAITAMARVGAALGWMNEAWWVLNFPGGGKSGSHRIVPELHKPHIILVDQAGRRFVNEAAPPMEVGRACLERNRKVPALPAWAIFDSRHRRHYSFGSALPGRTPRAWLRESHLRRNATLEGLARQCGIDPGGLEGTVTRWNTMAMRGIDEDFGKGRSAYNRYYGDGGHVPNPCMGMIAKPPFYAAPLVPGDVGTCGGVLTDEHARVRRADGSAIEGLYATGNCTAPLAGPHCAGTGQSIGSSAVFGMIAIRHLVR